MNKATRDALLRGVSGAAEAHDAFQFRESHVDGLRAIDVFATIAELQIPIAFEALDELLGACVRISSAEVGILVTTQRDLHMQRFTAAHELGHFVLGHEGSLDREIRMPGHTDGRDLREVEADAFAAEFLMPKWLVQAAAKRRKWWSADCLQDPAVVYQLSLRLASSYEATCWGLAGHEYIQPGAATMLVGDGKRLKEIKKRLLGGVALEDSWADVWHLRAGDNGAFLDAGPNDVFVLDLVERASTGFRWDVEEAVNRGFQVVNDMSSFDEGLVGGSASRRVAFRVAAPGTQELSMSLRRSFAGADVPPKDTFHVSISTIGTRRGEHTVAPFPNTLH